jgi:hypothetical protein
LTRHLAECPPIFLAEPVQPNGNGEVNVQAVVADLLRSLGQSAVGERELKKFKYSSRSQVNKERNRLRTILIGCWLAHHPELTDLLEGGTALNWLESGLDALSGLVKAESLVSDPDRREELSRVLLSVAGALPAGESKSEAENRLDALDTVKRDEVVRQAQAAQQRARLLREEMERKEAERRAASVYNHE